jgi:hypothetical protein
LTFDLVLFFANPGLIPYNYICVQTGELLTELTSTQVLMNGPMFVRLALIAVVALVPSYLVRQWNETPVDSQSGSYFELEQTNEGETFVRKSARLRAKSD